MEKPNGDGELKLTSEHDFQMLLVEYRAAQDSAEHHDRLVSSIFGVWVGSAVLIGFVLNGLGSGHFDRYKAVLILVVLVGLSLTCLSVYWATRSHRIKDEKYKRCQTIEKALHGLMSQHSVRANTGRRWRWQLFLAPFGLLAVVWVVLLVDVIRA
jgi:uncharacterized membrane protein